MHTIALIGVLLVLAVMIYGGYRSGLFEGVFALCRNLLAFLIGVTFCGPLTGLITSMVPDFELHPGPLYLRVISLALLFAITFGLAGFLRGRYAGTHVEAIRLVDPIAGSVLGFFNGVILTGIVLILWALMPFAKYIPGDFGRIQTERLPLDTGSIMLHVYDYVSGRMGGGKSFLLESEPITADANNDGLPDSRRDLDGDGAPDPVPGESFTDVNDNGRWDRGWVWLYRRHADFYKRDVDLAASTETKVYEGGDAAE